MAALDLPADDESAALAAIDAAQERCRRTPDDRAAWLDLTDLLANAQEWPAVIEVSRHCTDLFADWAEPWFRLSVAYEAMGELADSLRAATQAVQRDSDHLGAQALLGLRRVEVGERLDGMERLLAASQLTPHPFVLVRRAKAHLHADQPGPAEYWLHRILSDTPDSAEATALLAHLYEQTGRLEQAAETIRLVPSRQSVSLLTEAVILRRLGAPQDALDLLDPERPAVATLDAGLAAVERGRNLELLGRIDDAWLAFTEANQMARNRSVHGTEALSWFEQLRVWWSRQSPDRPRPASVGAQRTPLAFLVGLPRSGTTMLEQIITAATVASTTECSAMAIATAELTTRLGRDYPDVIDDIGGAGIDVLRSAYWEVLARWLVPDDTPVLDKLPLNLLYLAAIDAAFPETRIVTITRDPRDVVLSLYVQQFVDNSAMALTTTLEHAASLYVAGMELWFAARSNLRVPVLEIRYEDLVTEPVPELGRLSAFLGLELSIPTPHTSTPRPLISTPSYAAAGGVLHQSSIGRWSRYEKHLEPVLERLAPWVELHERAN